MPPESNAKGDRRERELVNALDEAGFAVMRAPASGSATARELPDILAGNAGAFYAIEVKSSGGQPIYLSGEEVYDLVHVFAQNFGAKPRIGVRFDREDWFFFRPGELHRTDGGNYRVKRERAVAEGQPFEALVEEAAAEAERNEGPDAELERVLRAVASGDLSVEDGVALLE